MVIDKRKTNGHMTIEFDYEVPNSAADDMLLILVTEFIDKHLPKEVSAKITNGCITIKDV